MTFLDTAHAGPSPAAGMGATGLIRAFIARYRRNRALKRMMELDDHLLHDIGLTRGDLTAMMR